MSLVTQILKCFAGADAQASTVTPAALLLPLEPRIVYDASVASLVVPQHSHETGGVHGTARIGAAESGEFSASAQIGAARYSNQAADRSTNSPITTASAQIGAARDAALATVPAPTEVVFIDSSVSDYQALIAALPANATYVILDPNQDGFAQMASYLQGKTGITSISLISHGMDGAIQAGSSWLTNADIGEYAADLSSIGASLKAGGQFQIYGCDVAEQADGQALVQSIAGLMHTSVAASTDNTGAASLGGDWTLEYSTGPSIATALFGANLPAYDGLLGVTDETYDADVGFDTPGGESGTTSFTLDGITYTTDQAIESVVDSFNENQFGPPPLTTSSAPNNGVLAMNLDETPLSSVNIKLSDGDPMALKSFDIDVVAGTEIWIEANGNPNEKIVLTTGGDGEETTFHVDVSNVASVDMSAAFTGITSFTIVDVGDSSGVFIPTIDNLTYTDMNSPPVLAKGGGNSGLVEADPHSGNTPVVVDSGITLADGNSTVQSSATVTIANFVSGQDVLGLTLNSGTMGNIAESFNTGTGVLSLTSSGGTATTAEWQAALDAVTYNDTAASPTTTTRNITFSLNDPYSTSNTITETVAVTHTDQTPIVTGAGTTAAYTAGSAAVTVDSGIIASDSDSPDLASATVSIGAGFQNGDTLALTINTSTMGSNLTESYNSSSGVLTLTATGATTVAQFEAALDAVKFSDASSATGGDRTISFVVNDGSKNSVALNQTIDVTAVIPVVTMDSGSTAFVAGDNTTSTPVAIDSGLVVTDPNSSTLASATVSIGTGFHSGEDTLAFTNTSNTTFGDIAETSYNAGTGMLTLSASGGATLAQWQAALEAVTYTDTAITPNTATRTISFVVNDGISSSAAATRTVTVADTDQTPLLSTSGGATAYLGGTAATAIDGGVSVGDRDNATLASGTVSVGSGFTSGDILSFSNTSNTTFGNISASYDSSTGVLTLTSATSSATDAQWASAFDAVTFSAAASTAAGNRTISFVVNDGSENSLAATKTVAVTVPPVLTLDSGSAVFTAGDNVTSTPVTVDSGLTVSDGSSATLASATVSISGNFHSGEDQLSLTSNSSTMGDITGSYDSTSGVMTLTGAGATTAQWQAALAAVTYTDTAISPNTDTRTISFVINDGSNTSATATRTVTVADTDQTPVVVSTSGATAYVGGTAATAIDGGVTVSDRDNTTLASATISIGSGFDSNKDTLSFTNSGGITGSYDAATGILTLTGSSATTAQWQTALDSISFSSTSTSYGNRTISFVVNDGTENSAAATKTVDMTAPPLVTLDSGSAAFTAGDNTSSTPVTIDSGLTVTDGSSPTLASATVSITGNFHSGEDQLSLTSNSSTMGDITGSYDSTSGVMTLTGAGATTAQWQAALAAVTYTDTAISPNTDTRTISFVVNDGSNTSATATRTVTVTDTDQTPVVVSTTGTTTYIGGMAATVVDGGVTVSDRDNATLASGTVSIGSGFSSGDTLSFSNTSSSTFGNISATYDSSTGVLTLTSATSSATDAQWANAFDAVTLSSTSTTYGNRTISFVVNDGSENSAAASKTFDVANPDPVVTTDTGSAAFTAGDNVVIQTPVAIDPGLTVTDPASSTLASATVSITGNFHAGEDVLSLGPIAGISESYDASTGVMTLTAGAGVTTAQWQAALEAVTYTDTAITPNTVTRTISFTVNDGSNTSAAATRTVTVADTDQTPVVVSTAGTTAYIGGMNATVIDGGVSVSDRDNATLASGTVSIGSGFSSGDILSFTNTNNTTFGNISATYNSTTGVLTLTSVSLSATDAQWANAFDAVTFSSTSSTFGNRAISFVVNDGTENSVAATKTVDVLNPAPVVTTDTGSAAFTAGDNVVIQTPVAIDPGLTVTDPASSTLASATVAITGNFHAGEDVLSLGPIAGINESYNSSTGVMTLTAGAGVTTAQWQAALEAVTYTDTAINPDPATRTISFVVNDGSNTSAAATRSVTVADTDQTPLLSGGNVSVTLTASGASSVVAVAPALSLIDRGNTALASATVSIGSGFDAGADVLGFTNSGAAVDGDITSSYNSSTGVLTLTSASRTATVAQWQAALNAVTYGESSASASSGTRVLSFSVSDGVKSSVAVTASVVVDAQQITAHTVSTPATTPSSTPDSSSSSGGDGTTASSDGPSNPLIVLSTFDPSTQVGGIAPVHTTTFSSGGVGDVFGTTSVSNQPGQTLSSFTSTQPSFAPPPGVERITVAADQPFSLTLQNAIPTATGDRSSVTVRQADGQVLPSWVHFDATTGTLSGTAPPDGPRVMRLVVVQRDSAGHLTRHEVVVNLGANQAARSTAHAPARPAAPPVPHAAAPAAKPSLTAQFERLRRELHVA